MGTGGASAIASAQIVDQTIINADINDAAAIEQHKIESSQGDNTDLISHEQTDGVSHALTTVAGQRVMVFVTGNINITNAVGTVTLKYNGVTKDTVLAGGTGAGASQRAAFAMQYSEIPGAATQNITVATSSGSVENCIIRVIKLMSA